MSGDRPRPDPTRVPPVEKQPPATQTAGRPPEELVAELERLSREILGNSRLSIQREATSGDFVYLMIDKDTGETIRRWPPETHQDLAEYLRTFKAGLVNKTA
ncbi:flagellar protein FlaG [Maricaulis salignorans]|uniref:Flagellar protein FlaG n=1 Tax=Maricaulis salignorans TaxID=144026 RepID=A0A1G9VFK5_9PROT|nr:flagellar protein FlaG [Maricaulis salignorans]SDM71058.1 flagellar protein FlaG [Maricaulis salignorans]